MNILELIWEGSFWQDQAIRLSLTLLHFIWQGLLVGLTTWIVLLICKPKSANRRYWIALGAFFCMPLLAIATYTLIDVPAEFASTVAGENTAGDFKQYPMTSTVLRRCRHPLALGWILSCPNRLWKNLILLTPTLPLNHLQLVLKSVAEPDSVSTIQAIYPFLPLVAAGYIAGVLLMMVRLQMKIWRGSRLCSRSPKATDQALLALMKKLANQAGLKFVPVIRYCDRVVVPTVVGILKPVVLMPASLVSQLTVDELTAILNHELAHIRRFDPVVQVVQKTVEALLCSSIR